MGKKIKILQQCLKQKEAKIKLLRGNYFNLVTYFHNKTINFFIICICLCSQVLLPI